jgi:succinate dehydrogenase / fumarate reductase cytochrome b subunit
MYNRRARPVAYHINPNQATTWAARSMIVSGTILLLFLVIHIAQIRGWLIFHNKGDSGGVYQNIQAGFEHWAVVFIYLLGQVALAFHLYHGLWSLFQTLGVSHPSYNHWRRPIAAVVGVGIASLNITLILLNLDFIQHL